MHENVESAIVKVAEAKILEAIEQGAFDDLPGKGKPLKLDDLSLVPEELRAGYILLKNSGYLPEDLELHKEITSLQRLIDSCTQEQDEEKKRLRKILEAKNLRYNILSEKRRAQKKIPRL